VGLQHCLLRWPGRIHFGLWSFDVMHHLYINCTGYLLDGLLANMTASQKRELDRRARALGYFRTHQVGHSLTHPHTHIYHDMSSTTYTTSSTTYLAQSTTCLPRHITCYPQHILRNPQHVFHDI
jgi:hypothetical protein